MKRIFKGPWLWILLAVVGVLLALQFLAPGGGYSEIPTSKMQEYVEKGEVKEITFIDGDQQVKAILDDGVEFEEFRQVMTHYIQGQQETLLKSVDEQVEKGDIEKSNSENPQPSLLGSMLATLLPFVLIIALFIFLMNQVQGGGRGVMQFGKNKAKLDLQPAPARRCSRAPSPVRPESRSTRSPVPTSSRCSSASVPPEFATCSNRRSRTPPASSSSTRSTPSAAIAAPAWAAVTTSASRPSTSCWWRWTASTRRPTSS